MKTCRLWISFRCIHFNLHSSFAVQCILRSLAKASEWVINLHELYIYFSVIIWICNDCQSNYFDDKSKYVREAKIRWRKLKLQMRLRQKQRLSKHDIQMQIEQVQCARVVRSQKAGKSWNWLKSIRWSLGERLKIRQKILGWWYEEGTWKFLPLNYSYLAHR